MYCEGVIKEMLESAMLIFFQVTKLGPTIPCSMALSVSFHGLGRIFPGPEPTSESLHPGWIQHDWMTNERNRRHPGAFKDDQTDQRLKKDKKISSFNFFFESSFRNFRCRWNSSQNFKRCNTLQIKSFGDLSIVEITFSEILYSPFQVYLFCYEVEMI